MTWLGRLFRRRKLEAQLDSELRFHLEQRTADLIATGVEPAEARRRALIEFGGLDRAKEECREARGWSFAEDTWRDICYGVRMLRKSPGFAAVAILTLALGIGANTAIFSAVNRILLHPLPYPQPNSIVAISRTGQALPQARHMKGAPVRITAPRIRRMSPAPGLKTNGLARHPAPTAGRPGPVSHRVIKLPAPAHALRERRSGSPRGRAVGPPPGPMRSPGTGGHGHVRAITVGASGKPRRGFGGVNVFSYPDFEDLRAHSGAFEEIAAYHQAQVTLTRRGQPASIRAVVASASLFRLLRAKPLLGRLFTSQDDREGAAPVALIGAGLWRSRFDSDPQVIGKTIGLNNQAYTIIGVLPASLRFPPFVAPAQAWIPLVSDPSAQIQQMRLKRGLVYLSVIGRLKPGETLKHADAELSTLADRLAMSYPNEPVSGMQAIPLARQLVRHFRLALLVLLAAVGLVLLIACANVANLLLARATVRERELALRLALGAGRGGIVRQMLIESVELALAGGVAGVFLAYVAVAAFVRHLPPAFQEFQGISVSGPVLVFAALVSMGAGIVMGLLPALRLSDLRVHEILKGAGSSTGLALARGRLRQALVVLEVALAVILLAGAGLLLRSFGDLVSVPLGFEPQGVMMARANLSAAGYHNPSQWKSFVFAGLQRLRAQPGVLQAAVATAPPMSGMRMIMTFSIPGHPLPPEEIPVVSYRAITPGYFSLMRIPLLRGRGFRATDTDSSARVCIVNQAFVERYFPNVDPLTRQIRTGMPPAAYQIVGVVGNVVSGSLSNAPGPALYIPFAQSPFFVPSFLVRSAGSPAAMVSTLSAQLHALDPALPVAPVTLTSLLSRSLAQRRLRTVLVTLFAALAVLLAAVGISGVLGYSVSRRTQEIGLRLALGAAPGNVLWQIVGEGLRLVAVGAVLGLGAALGLTRFIASLLYGVSATDPLTYAGVSILLLFAGLAACYVPARRAARVDPVVALRQE